MEGDLRFCVNALQLAIGIFDFHLICFHIVARVESDALLSTLVESYYHGYFIPIAFVEVDQSCIGNRD